MSAYRTAPARPQRPPPRRRWFRLLMRVERVGRWGMSLNPSAVKWYSLTYFFGVTTLCPLLGLVMMAHFYNRLVVALVVALAAFVVFNLIMGAVPIVPGLLRVRRRLRAIRRGQLRLRVAAPPPLRAPALSEDEDVEEEHLPAARGSWSTRGRGR